VAEPEGLREKKKRATRQAISDVATRLFAERGFEAVTVDEIAKAAGVSRMTLFNYFPRKEDLVVDREPEMLALIRGAIDGDQPIAGLRRLFTELTAAGHPLMGSVPGAPAFWRLISSSPVLLARIWSMAEAMEKEVAHALHRRHGDLDATLIAASVVALWRAAWREGIRRVGAGEPLARVRAWQQRLLTRGFDAIDLGLEAR